MSKIRIKATFLDEISTDIPHQNWGYEEWARDFDAMRAVGIDTVVASPKPITYYQNNGCGCCAGTYPSTNQIAITTSINVATA